MPYPARMDSLVTTDWLAARLGAPDLVILDASSHLPDAGRDARAEFAAAHIAGARFLDLATLIDPESAIPATIPMPEQFAARMATLGIEQNQRVVLYDDSAVKTSARAWFILRMYGVKDIAILDGGLGKWRAEGRPVESGEPTSSPEQFVAQRGPGLLRTKSQIWANLDSEAEQVVDARSAARFTGEEPDFRPDIASGHIPGSWNVPFDRLFKDDGTFKDGDGIRAAFAETGVDLTKPVVTTCGGGVTAAVLLFALHLIGKHDVALYDGSWSEWGADPDTPKATGEAA